LPGLLVDQTNRVDSLVRDARTRHLLILAGEQFAVCLILVCTGGVLMLLAGTQILNWYWLVPLLVAGLAAGWVRFRRRAIPAYRVAQILDVRLDLRDTISTAWFLRHDAARAALDLHTETGMVRTQFAQAEALAATSDPRPAFPVSGKKTWAAACVMLAVVIGLFGVRYLVSRSLDLKRALIPLPQLGNVLASMEKHLLSPRSEPGDHNQVDGAQPSEEARNEQPNDPRMNEVLGVKNPNDSDAASSDPNGTQGPKTEKMDAANGDPSPNAESGKQSDGSPDSRQADSQQPSQKGAAPNNSQPQSGPQDRQQASSSPGLLDKMKDAMSSLVSKMRPSSSPQSAQNSSKQPNNGDDEDKSPGSQGEQAQSKQQGSNNQQAGQEANAQGEENSQTAERAQNAQGRNSDRSSDKNGNDAHSGVGRQDGAKELKEAQQQEAMGKLAEIIGKRSANLTGEVLVEVPNGKQQLQTQYSQKVGRHADLGGEINRDEVPLLDQQYVREYMEQVHKQTKNLN
jgi:hypothetical protein